MAEAVRSDERRVKRIIAYLVGVPLALVLLVLLYEGAKARLQDKIAKVSGPLTTGSEAPDFSFPDLDGKTVRLRDLRGKVVFINIWATWCPTCVWEMPSMELVHQEYKKRDFVMLAVDLDILGKEVVLPFMEKHRLTFPVLLDPKGTIKRIYRTTGVPETFIVDKRGILRHIEIGPREWSHPQTMAMIGRLIDEPAEPAPVSGLPGEASGEAALSQAPKGVAPSRTPL
ncbi:MAG: TlpA family protein disulfide reductase [Candidatus Tectomicrobia bacterium]|nr:TlpA family protein disulfide reductase [Candidatus Tectomicrobia bacterium]